MEILLEIKGLTKAYGKNQILHNCNLTIEKNRIIGVVGENGIGKSTFLKLLAGLCEPQEGTIVYGDSIISYLFDRGDLYPWMKVSDAITYYQDFYTDFDKSKAQTLLQQSSIPMNEKITRLSTGNAERLCMVLALSRQADLYLFDEPLGGIDPGFKKEIKKLLLGNIKEGATVIMATHLLRDLDTIFDQIIIMKNGSLKMVEAEEVRERHHSLEQYYLEVTEDATFTEMGV